MSESNGNVSYPTAGTAKRTALGIFVDFLGQGITVLEHILFVPLFLWAWGSALYGEWLTLFSLIAYLSLGNIGMNNFVVNKMTQYYARGDIKNYIRTFKSALSLYIVIVGALSVFWIIFVFAAPLFSWFDLATAGESSVRVSILILGLYVLWGIIFGLINAMYFSVGEFVRYKILLSIKELLLIGFIALTLFFKGGFVSVASWYLIILFLFTVFVFWDIRRRYPELDFNSVKTDWKLGISFLVPGLIFLLIPLAEMIQIQGSVLLISSSLGAVAVVIFSVHRTLVNLVRRLTSTLQAALRPELAADEARGNYEKIRLIHNLLIKIVFFVSVSAVVFLFFMGEDIIRVWTGGRIEFQPTLWLLFLISVPITALWQFSAIFQIATNKYTKLAVIRITSAFIGLILAAVFIKSFGIAGVLLGFVLVEILLNSWFIPYKTLRLIKESVKGFIFMLIRGLPILIIQLPIAWVLNEYVANTWLRLGAIGAVVALTGITFTYFIWLNESERGIVSNLLKNYTPAALRR